MINMIIENAQDKNYEPIKGVDYQFLCKYLYIFIQPPVKKEKTQSMPLKNYNK